MSKKQRYQKKITVYLRIANIKNKYVDYGLYTAEEMNPKYAEDPMWASKVNNYIEKIRNILYYIIRGELYERKF
mgnify:CR=1 FL=1